MEEAADEITRLTAENERLRAALHEAAAELDAYYRDEYPGNHPYFKQRLAEAMRQNPARIAITQENTNDKG
jgi:phage regulator Rha-like protein